MKKFTQGLKVLFGAEGISQSIKDNKTATIAGLTGIVLGTVLLMLFTKLGIIAAIIFAALLVLSILELVSKIKQKDFSILTILGYLALLLISVVSIFVLPMAITTLNNEPEVAINEKLTAIDSSDHYIGRSSDAKTYFLKNSKDKTMKIPADETVTKTKMISNSETPYLKGTMNIVKKNFWTTLVANKIAGKPSDSNVTYQIGSYPGSMVGNYTPSK